ncbi:MAG: cyclophilin [endosymbiont of Galathealinum brachiosum]|uniref:Peptidyl-prolyl cis-trans isomerase n=1 Tax=endosymbiont of Galathealinum brachiosum TaxID=2200906 RepID=A0A370DJH7_9GAMM|nr:MAG: cyclophilin [endosymbiont of Galathealinum brachiosum]
MSDKICLDTNHGKIIIELNSEKAPISAENFLTYVKEEFFNNTIFHRVIPGFMIQGGGFIEGMEQKATNANIKNEADNGLGNKRGTLAMARTPDPDSASSQFFINLKDNDFLNYTAPTSQGWGYAVFGEVTEGMDVVDSIAQVATGNNMGHGDVPVETVIINSATLV